MSTLLEPVPKLITPTSCFFMLGVKYNLRPEFSRRALKNKENKLKNKEIKIKTSKSKPSEGFKLSKWYSIIKYLGFFEAKNGYPVSVGKK